MNEVFNSNFENALRIMLILSVSQKSYTLDKLALIDFFVIYGKTLGLTDTDMHGQNIFAFCEFANKRDKINDGIKFLMNRGLIETKTSSKGFCYKLNKVGKSIVMQFNSTYKNKYLKNLEKVLEFISNKTEARLQEFLNNKTKEMEIYNG